MDHSSKLRILLVDDEAELTTPLSRVLSHEGYEVDLAQDGQQGLSLAQLALSESTTTPPYSLLILDWMLPRTSGLEICRTLRQQGDQTPVLFLTAKDTLDDRVEGLDAGADDYLVKPFELRELLARVRALLRRPPIQEGQREEGGGSSLGKAHGNPEAIAQASTPPASSTVLSLGGLDLEPDNRLARRQGRRIELSEKETLLLTYLMRHPEALVTHGEIQTFLWGSDRQPSSNVLAAQIRLLRRKIEAPGEAPLIHTVYGKGYRFGLLQSESSFK